MKDIITDDDLMEALYGVLEEVAHRYAGSYDTSTATDKTYKEAYNGLMTAWHSLNQIFNWRYENNGRPRRH